MVEILKDLKQNYNVLSVKAEFEAEGTRMEEAIRLKDVVSSAGLPMTIKIGGCEALKDMYDARTLGVCAIVAPMIESAYAMRKFLHMAKAVFPEEERNSLKLMVNIETITGFKHLDEMLESPYSKDLTGIVFGRTDMTGSLGMGKDDINHDIILDYAQKICEKVLKHKKELVIGGGVSAQSLPFFRHLPAGALTRFETRKVIFGAVASPNTSDGILKAVGFELMWIKNKRNFYKNISEEDLNRINVLESRYKDSILKAGGQVDA
jgi:hypothetical protein